MTLRDKIIKALSGSSGQKPVMLDALRKIAEPLCDDLQQLYGLLDQLYAAHAVNRASGFKDGKQYVAYWETGAPPPAITFRITQPQPPQQRVHQIPRAQAIPPKAPATTTQETTMAKQNQDRSGKLRAFLLDLIVKQPGISKVSLTEYAEVEFPDAGDRIRQTLGNLVTGGHIKGEGKRGSLTYRATGSTKPASAPPPSQRRAIKTQARGRSHKASEAQGLASCACSRRAPRRLRPGIQLRLRRSQGRRRSHLQERHLGRACAR